MQGVSFGGVPDKSYTRTPNEGNRCAYPDCALGNAIAEGAPARMAKNDPTLWCHRPCADEWEAKDREGIPVGSVPEEPTQTCAAPHPEDPDVSCTRDEHANGHHLSEHDGKTKAWFMEPHDAAALKEKRSQQNLAADLEKAVYADEPQPVETAEGLPEREHGEALKTLQDAQARYDENDDAMNSTPRTTEVQSEAVVSEGEWQVGKAGDIPPGIVHIPEDRSDTAIHAISATFADNLATARQMVALADLLEAHGATPTPDLIAALLDWKHSKEH